MTAIMPALADTVTRFGRGEHGVRAGLSGSRETQELASSFNALADEVETAMAELRAEEQRKSRFVSDVSHELRSPLTTLATAVQVLEARRGELPERSQLALDLVVYEIARFQHVVSELLELSRADAGVADASCRVGRISVRNDTRVAA